MPPIRPLLRQFPRPTTAANAASRAPYLVSMMTAPSNALQQSSLDASATAKTPRMFTTSAIRSSGDETHYEPPGGWLFGVPPGEKYKKEGWENIFVWGFWGSLAVAVVAYAYKPDTSIQTWALEEARRRLEAEGILPDPDAKN